MKRLFKPRLPLKLLLSSLCIVHWNLSGAVDHLNLEHNLPLVIEDAYPIPYHGREFQARSVYESGNQGKDRLLIEPRLELGIALNWQMGISVPFEFESGGRNGLGEAEVDALYNFNTESLMLPAFAVAVGLELPTGSKSAGLDPSLTLIATKTLGAGENLNRLHLNLSYFLNDDPRQNERNDGFSAVMGYSQRFGSETILLADIVYEQEKHKDDELILIEIGARYQTTPRNTIALGAGAGLNNTSPDFRLTLGFQQSF